MEYISRSIKGEHIILIFIIIGTLLMVHSSNLILKYLFPGDKWRILRCIKNMNVDQMFFFDIKHSYYPIFWQSIIFGCSSLFGLPVVNTQVLLTYFNFITIISIFQCLRIIFKRKFKHYKSQLILAFTIIMLIINSYVYSTTFFHGNLYWLSILWNVAFLFFYVQNHSNLDKKQKNFILFLSTFSIFLGFIIHFAELFLLPATVLLLLKVDDYGKRMESLIKIILSFSVLFVLINLITDNYYSKFIFYSVGLFISYINPSSAFLDFNSPHVYSLAYVGLIFIILIILIPYIIYKIYNFISNNQRFKNKFYYVKEIFSTNFPKTSRTILRTRRIRKRKK
ncbi:MAG: hypothetical protein ACFFDH_12385, partial [Promethearchaeota archaeon]